MFEIFDVEGEDACDLVAEHGGYQVKVKGVAGIFGRVLLI